MNMASHELAGIIGIIAIWTTLGAFFAGYYFAKRKSKKHFEKSGEKTAGTNSKNNDYEQKSTKTDDSEKRESKEFDWI